MKKIAVVAANGNAGKLIVKEALSRGHDVTAIVRSENQTEATKVIQKDIMSLTQDDLAGFDAVIDAFGTFDLNRLHEHIETSQHLADLVANSDTRLLIVGGAGSLYVDKELTTQLYTTESFPQEIYIFAKAQADELHELRKRSDVKWTFVSPAIDFRIDGERSGDYIVANEVLTFNANGESILSYADYAIAMIDEIESGNHIQERISILKA